MEDKDTDILEKILIDEVEDEKSHGWNCKFDGVSDERAILQQH